MESYNKKHADTALGMSDVHFVDSDGNGVSDETVVESVYKDGGE